jgi:hypothetical protein
MLRISFWPSNASEGVGHEAGGSQNLIDGKSGDKGASDARAPQLVVPILDVLLEGQILQAVAVVPNAQILQHGLDLGKLVVHTVIVAQVQVHADGFDHSVRALGGDRHRPGHTGRCRYRGCGGEQRAQKRGSHCVAPVEG